MAGQKRMRVRVDERNMQTSYVNGFRTTVTAEEVILDLGINLTVPTGRKEDPVEMVFQANNRVILNCYVAKRLAGTLAQIVQHHEQQSGPIELNAAKRRVDNKARLRSRQTGLTETTPSSGPVRYSRM